MKLISHGATGPADRIVAVAARRASSTAGGGVALVTMATPRDRLGRGIGAQRAAQALGLTLGPTVGGVLQALVDWPPAGPLSLGHELGVSLPLLGLVVVAVALRAGFVVHERSTASPMLDVALLGRRPFAARIASGLLS